MFDFGILEKWRNTWDWGPPSYTVDFNCGCRAITQELCDPEIGAFHGIFVAPVLCHAGCDFVGALEMAFEGR